jgi:hypothetical protein
MSRVIPSFPSRSFSLLSFHLKRKKEKRSSRSSSHLAINDLFVIFIRYYYYIGAECIEKTTSTQPSTHQAWPM